MKLLALAAFIAVPTGEPAAVAHEKVLKPRTEQLAVSTLPESIWHIEGGNGVHAQSTLVCPASVDDFQRNQLFPFDNFGLDVGCNFDAQGTGRITLYLTRRGARELAQDFEDAKTALQQNMPDAQPVAGAPPVPTGQSFTSAVYTRADGARTGLWVADVHGWTFKFRATYVADREPRVVAAMTTLTEKLNETAAKHLGSCAAAPPAQRRGTTITDRDKNSKLAIVAVVLFGADEPAAPGAAKDHWCAEDPIGDREIPMLFWRNIASDGSTDRITLMTVGPPPALFSADNPLLPTVLDDGSGQIYQLTGSQGDVSYVFAFFNGRPASATLSPMVKEIFLGKRKPLAAYDTKTNSIIISVDAGKPGEGMLLLRHEDIPSPFATPAKLEN
jgi:hypothetical protein